MTDPETESRHHPVKAWQANTRKINLRLLLAGLVARLLPYDMFNHRRASIYRATGIRVGGKVQILGPLTLVTAHEWGNKLGFLEIGDGAVLDTPCTLTLVAPLRIGDRVRVGMDALILTGSHAVGRPEERCGDYQFAPVTIGDGCWLGARVTVLPGVEIGAGCVVAAGSVVTRNMPPNSMIAGNPARVIGKLDDAAPEMKAVSME